MRKNLKWLALPCLSLAILSCVEEFEPENITDVLDGSLVVDARITDQNIQQAIFLTRTFSFDEIDPPPETGAQVSIIDDLGKKIDFFETQAGNYYTNGAVSLLQEREYTLEIFTKDGVQYRSNKTTLPKQVEVSELKAERSISNSNTDGISILVDNTDNTSSVNYFRYEYEETYKVIPPDFNPFDWDEVDYDFFCEDDDGWEVTVAPRDEPANICFATNKSNSIILASTANLTSNNLDDFEVRFIDSDNYAISHRYSILVKQYHHDINAASFFGSLEDFSNSESLFSNVQTGQLEGNITVENSDIANVIGYFELSSYSEKRMFFNYEDFFPNEDLPPYIIACDFISNPPLYPEGFHVTLIDGKPVLDGASSSPLMDGILAGLIGYIGENEDYQQTNDEGEFERGPFFTKPLGCIDCRVYGDNVIPDFWIEE